MSELSNNANDGYDSNATSSSPTKLFPFFRSKKTSSSQQRIESAPVGAGGTLQSFRGSQQTIQSNTLNRNNNTNYSNTNAYQSTPRTTSPYGNSVAATSTNGRYPSSSSSPQSDGYGANQRFTASPAGSNGFHGIETMQQANYQQPVYSASPGFFGAGAESSGCRTPHSAAYVNSPATVSTYAHGGVGVHPPEYNVTSSAESRRDAMSRGGGQRSFDERLPIPNERRNSLPSIMKAPAAQLMGGRASSAVRKPTPTAVSATNATVAERPQIDTYVIDKGVRKFVRCV